MNFYLQDYSDTWQQILALDLRFSHVRPSMCDDRSMRALYLTRRHQLSKENAHATQFFKDLVSHGAAMTREQYKCIRENILTHLYGSGESSRLSVGSSNGTKPLTDSPKCYTSVRSSFCSESVDQLSCRSFERITPNTESLTAGYTFSGIDYIFDHHTKAVTRLRFANNDNTRLAIASADGTISLCCSWPPECEKHVVHLTGGHQFGASVTDVLWSLSNDFLVSTAVDGSVCVWDAVKASLTRRYSPQSLAVGPALVCCFQPQNYNQLIVGGGSGVIQTLNLSTGKAIKKGRDQLHFSGFKHPHRRVTTSLLLDFHCTGRGSITALTFETATGTCLWVGTDRGIIQSYLCDPDCGQLTRAHRISLVSILMSSTEVINITSAGPNLTTSSKQPQTSFRQKLINKEKTSRAYPSVTSLSFHSWLSRDNRNAYLLGNAAGLGLLLFQVTPSTGGQLTLTRRFPVPHSPLIPLCTTGRLHLIHSCLAPLLSMRSGSCAITGSEDSNVYLFDVLFDNNSLTATKDTTCKNRLQPGLLTMLQGHKAPVVDVAIGWDESVLASGDENGLVIIWRRMQRMTDLEFDG